jgi:NTP pyrophosphatase (non-canonical NTP hydrolase)
MTTDDAMLLVRAELERARDKFGSFQSTHEGYAVILEELDELWEAIRKGGPAQRSDEAAQVAAMAVRFLTDLCS